MSEKSQGTAKNGEVPRVARVNSAAPALLRFNIARFFYVCWRVICIPLADRLNRSPPVCECSLITTPLSFLR